MSISIFLDEDFLEDRKVNYTQEELHNRLAKWLSLENYVKRNLLEKGTISRMTFNRFFRIGFAVYGNNSNIVMPSKFNELFEVKPINIKLCSNAWKKVMNELKKSNVKDVPDLFSEVSK